jgi:hypothetical protein
MPLSAGGKGRSIVAWFIVDSIGGKCDEASVVPGWLME